MRAIKAILAGGIILLLTVSAEAKSLRQSKGPAELPPSSYKSAQYIDSRGCMFIRAGFGGNVQWIPRVTRNRQVICGQKPSGVAGATKPVSKQPARRTPTQTTVAAAQPPLAAPPKRKAANWNWFGQPNKQARSQPTQQPQRTASQTTYGTPRAKPVSKPARVAVAVPHDPYTSNHAIRRSPQAVHPSDHLNGRAGYATAGQSVQVARATTYALPEGYKSLLDDGRAVPRRGVGTPQGQAQMDLIWTQTTPRRLINVYTGQDVTAQLPQIRYPYTTASTRAYSATSATQIAPVRQPRKKKRKPHDAASPSNMKNIEDVSALVIAPVETAAAPVIAVKTTTPSAKPASHRFIQVATFGVPSNASRTVSRFNANGLPTTTRALKRNGKSYAIVLLGPFKDDAAIKAALHSARGAGFSDAFFVR